MGVTLLSNKMRGMVNLQRLPPISSSTSCMSRHELGPGSPKGQLESRQCGSFSSPGGGLVSPAGDRHSAGPSPLSPVNL